MELNRRIFMGATGATFTGLLAPSPLLGQVRAGVAVALRAPVFSSRNNLVFAGYRPVRPTGFRLDIDRLAASGSRYWINNYGHGGGGITLSWGCAEQVSEWVSRLPRTTGQRRRVVVLGAGVIGLTVAKLLTERMSDLWDVSVYADQITGRNVVSDGVGGVLGTTSDNAGGQFEPSFGAFRTQPAQDEARAKQTLPTAHVYSDAEIIRLSYNRFISDRHAYRVSSMPNYMTISSSGPPSNNNLERTRVALTSSSQLISSVSNYRADLAGPVARTFIGAANAVPGHGIPCNYVIQTLLVEVPQMMGWLRRNLKDRLNLATFNSRDEVLARFNDVDVIVNCLGCDGAVIAGGDNDIQPTLGVVLGLPPLYARQAKQQPGTHYLYGGLGYIFARADCTIVGGWKKSVSWRNYRAIGLKAHADWVGSNLISYMGNFVKGVKQSGPWLKCFAGDAITVANFDSTINPNDFLEMDGRHVCDDNPIPRLR